MTTIAWDGKTLAADSQITGENFIYGVEDRKIFRVNKDLIATAGDSAQCLSFVDWYRDQSQDYPEKMDDLAVLVITSNGAFEYTSHKTPQPVTAPHSVGSGSGFAMGAMLAGASSKKAVDIASRLCKYTGGPVRTMRLTGR